MVSIWILNGLEVETQKNFFIKVDFAFDC